MAHVNLSHQPEQDWASYWRSRPLPILQVSKQALQAMARRADRVRVEDVAEVVLADPLLTLSVLRYMGQRPRSSLAAEVVSVQGIVMLMGVLPFLERFQSLSTVESILSEHQEDYAAYLQCIFQSRFSARLAMLYADWRYDARLDEIQVASLLSYSNDLLRILGKQIDKNLPEVPTQVTSLLTRLKVPNVIIQLLGEVENAPIRIQLLAAVG